MNCISCNSTHIQKDGNHKGYQRYKCMDCKKRFDGEKYEDNHIIHFKTKLKKTDRNRLTRENYCIPKKELDYREKKNIQIAVDFVKQHKRPPLLCPQYYYEIPNEIFEDAEHYTDEFLKSHYQRCMDNFDLNMNYFSKLDYNKFNDYLIKFVKKEKFIEIDDLETVTNKTGVYILVLDKYKQVYIGISDSMKGIKNRILQHWSKKKEFARLLNGSVETSILSIDSFGALDTTRIFYKELKWYQDIHEYEEKIVEKFKKEYRLNRVCGGLNEEEHTAIRNMKLVSSIQERKLK